MPGRSASLYVPITLRKARPTCGASAMAVWLPGSTSPARSCTTPVARAWKNSSPAASEAKVASSPAAAGSEAGQQAEDEEADDAHADPPEDSIPGGAARSLGLPRDCHLVSAVPAELRVGGIDGAAIRSEEHTSELQS